MNEDKILDSIVAVDRIFEINNMIDDRYKVETDPRINLDELTKDDENPMFATVEVIRNGMSANKRNYSVGVVQDLLHKVVGTVGYLGHSDFSKVGFEFREPQSIMVGASSLVEDDGTIRILGKAYIFKNSPLREWLPKSIACGNPMSVSIQGKAKCFENLDKSIDVQQIVNLESIDWCNAGTQGMKNSLNLSLTTEMVQNPNSNIIVDRKGDVDMQEENNVIKEEIVDTVVEEQTEVVAEEVADIVDEQVKEVSEQIEEVNETVTQISEMEIRITELETTISERDARISELENEISEIRAEQERKEIEAYKESKIAEMVDEDRREAFAKRINGTTKEEIDNQIQEMVDFVKEMGGFDNPVPKPQTKEITTDNLREQVIALFSGKR